MRFVMPPIQKMDRQRLSLNITLILRMYICICRGINEERLRDSVQTGLDSMDKLERVLGIGTQCGNCREHAELILHDELESKSLVAS